MYFQPKGYLKSYLKPAQPEAVYRYGLHEGVAAKWLSSESRSIVLRWLDAQALPHTLPKPIAKAVLDSERCAPWACNILACCHWQCMACRICRVRGSLNWTCQTVAVVTTHVPGLTENYIAEHTESCASMADCL